MILIYCLEVYASRRVRLVRVRWCLVHRVNPASTMPVAHPANGQYNAIMNWIAELVVRALLILTLPFDRNAQYFKNGEWHYLWPYHQDNNEELSNYQQK